MEEFVTDIKLVSRACRFFLQEYSVSTFLPHHNLRLIVPNSNCSAKSSFFSLSLGDNIFFFTPEPKGSLKDLTQPFTSLFDMFSSIYQTLLVTDISGTDCANGMAPQKNPQNQIHKPHDHFFRESMQDIVIARNLAKLTIPPSIQNYLDWETLEIVKDTWVDENLREHRSDTIYRAKLLGDDQWVYLLFEHKSASDKKVQIQLLRYIVEI
ncbi:MAG: Rpn family recombination-promoting nuclease/putative transposase [Fibrobacter sp.]|nr:Rpn family recombination-promoting nuclease/putative transposase [Fibrobacter sp.]